MRELIVEADGGSRGNPGPAGYGAVVRDSATGGVLAEAAEYLGHATNNVAEYRGLIAGLRAAHRIAPDARVLVRMDSKLVVEQMSGRWRIKHPDMRPLAAEAAAVLPADRVRYEWIPRASNGHADRLANEAMDAGARGRPWEPSASTAELDTAGATGSAPQGTAAGAATEAESSSPGWTADPGAATTLALLRHGETRLTPEKRFSGSGAEHDPELSEEGERQAAAAAVALADRGSVQAVVTSPLARCRRTAEVAAAALGLTPEVEPGLRETDFAAWEGLTFAEVRELHPRDLRAWLASSDAAPTGGGESFAAVARRSAAARERITARHHGRSVLVVSHVTPIKSLVRLALGAPPGAMFRMELSPASLTTVTYYSGQAVLRGFNDTSHLR